MRETIKKLPFIGPAICHVYRRWIRPARQFPGSAEYWTSRYASGGNSGAGSYGKFSQFKADIINDFVLAMRIKTVIEFGCGDGNQLLKAVYPSYTGFDIAPSAVALCRATFSNDKSKQFKLMKDYHGETADLTLSLDVVYHLIEDEVFVGYMNRLFNSSDKFIIIYSSDSDAINKTTASHIKHRKISDWVERNKLGILIKHIPNPYPFAGDEKVGSFADFFIYEKSKSDSKGTGSSRGPNRIN